MIPEHKVREVLEKTSIVEVVSEYVQLRRAGANFLGLCPFHSEKTPSFNVSPAREIFHCFGCGTGGNAFSFVMKIEGLGFPDAVKLLARKAGVQIEERELTQREKQLQDQRQLLQKICVIASDYYRTTLLRGEAAASARAYLEKRQAFGDIAAAYGLGFASERWDGLARHLKSQNVDLADAEKLGIVRKGDSGWYDLLRNRLVFPIRNHRGEPIAFAGRVLDGSLPKYINTPESPLYHKSSVLFGLDLALPAVRTEKSIIVVEGYFDHLALYRAGVRNVVATCGTALTTDHVEQLKRHVTKVNLLFDGDVAGHKATIRAMELFLEQKVPAYVITLPDGDDPDSFLDKNTADAFQDRLGKARPVFDFFIRTVLTQIPPNSVDNRVRIIDELAPRFRKISDPLERELYEKEICRLLGITSHVFRKKLGGMKVLSEEWGGEQSDRKRQGDPRQELLLALMIRYDEACEEIVSRGVDSLFGPAYGDLARLFLVERENAGGVWSPGHLLEKLEDVELKSVLSRLLVSDDCLEGVNWRDAFESCQRGKEERELRVDSKGLAAQLAALEPDSEEYTALLRQAETLRTRKSKR